MTVAVGAAPTASAQSVQRFAATGTAQSFVVPAGVTQLTVALSGAAGGGSSGGTGGVVSGRLNVAPGQVLQVMVGTRGGSHGGFNGGGDPGVAGGQQVGQNVGGGGASDIRVGACAATLSCGPQARIMVAGGGGGGDAANARVGLPSGGDAGNPVASDGTAGNGAGGIGASTIMAGSGGLSAGANGDPGDTGLLAVGGSGGTENDDPYCAGAGGGGGWYGGGGGGSDATDCNTGGAGGGGSSYADGLGLSDIDYGPGSTGDGWVEISPPSISSPVLGMTAATSVTGSTAVVHGTVGNVASAMDVSFVVSESNNFSTGLWLSTALNATATRTVSQTLTGLGASHTYSVWLVATGDFGRVVSDRSTFTTAGVPARPFAPVGQPSAGRGTVLVSWLASAANGMPVTSYVVTAHPSGRSCTAAGSSRSCVVSGLVGPGPFVFDVHAVNAVGRSQTSVLSMPVNPNLKATTVRVSAPSKVKKKKKFTIKAIIPGGYSGRVTVSAAGKRVCAKTVTGVSVSCKTKARTVGRHSISVTFVGAGRDSGVTGSAIRVFRVVAPKSTKRVLSRPKCAGSDVRFGLLIAHLTCGGIR